MILPTTLNGYSLALKNTIFEIQDLNVIYAIKDGLDEAHLYTKEAIKGQETIIQALKRMKSGQLRLHLSVNNWMLNYKN